MKPFGVEYLEEMVPVPITVFGGVNGPLQKDLGDGGGGGGGGTSVCCSYTTAFPSGATDSGDDGCSTD